MEGTLRLQPEEKGRLSVAGSLTSTTIDFADLGLLEEDRPVPGDWVLIHVGFAMSKISEKDALDQLHTLEMLGESEAAEQEVRGYGLEDVQEKQAP